MIEKGELYKRRVYTIFNVLEDFGGIEESICLVCAPFVAKIAERSFNYDMVSKHMKIKRRNTKKYKMPAGVVDAQMAKNIFDLSSIHQIKSLNSDFL